MFIRNCSNVSDDYLNSSIELKQSCNYVQVFYSNTNIHKYRNTNNVFLYCTLLFIILLFTDDCSYILFIWLCLVHLKLSTIFKILKIWNKFIVKILLDFAE